VRARVGDLIRRRICFNGAAKFSHLEAPAMKFLGGNKFAAAAGWEINNILDVAEQWSREHSLKSCRKVGPVLDIEQRRFEILMRLL
jgi:hypothetical protein